MDTVELSRRIENLIRFGSIHSVDHAKRLCRVQSGGMVTQWLPWIERRAGATTTWDPPTIGEQCVVLSPSGEPAGGMVFYGAPSDVIDTPSHAPEKHVIRFPDGATFSYDHDASHLEITGIATATIEARDSVTIDTPLVQITHMCRVYGPLIQVNGPLSSNGIVLDTHHHIRPPAGDPV